MHSPAQTPKAQTRPPPKVDLKSLSSPRLGIILARPSSKTDAPVAPALAPTRAASGSTAFTSASNPTSRPRAGPIGAGEIVACNAGMGYQSIGPVLSCWTVLTRPTAAGVAARFPPLFPHPPRNVLDALGTPVGG